MNILFISTADLRHGAGIAAFRLHQALRKEGHSSHMIVAEKTSTDPNVISLIPPRFPKIIRAAQDIIELGFNTLGSQNIFSFFKAALKDHPLVQEADVIHCHNLHWPFKNFPLEFLQIGQKKPLIWTFHDMWPITGHCFYSRDCEKWQTGCKGGCPQLFSFIPLAWDSSPQQWQLKKNLYSKTKFSVITPSRWLTQSASQSPLLAGHKTLTIPNVIDVSNLKVLDSADLKKKNDINPESKAILFIAGNINVPVKGLEIFMSSLESIKCAGSAPTILIAGKGVPPTTKTSLNIKYLGKINKPSDLNEIYNIADLTVVPSLAENLSNVVLESMACGTPVVGSNVGGIPDMIDHKVNGYLFPPGDPKALAEGIDYFLSDHSILNQAGISAREKVLTDFSPQRIVQDHLELYQSLINNFNST